jgi:hypothetical protein
MVFSFFVVTHSLLVVFMFYDYYHTYAICILL